MKSDGASDGESPNVAHPWVAVADSHELADGGAIERVSGSDFVAIFRHQGELFAIEGLCAHHGGPLSQGVVENGCVTCPWHGWQYRLCDGTQSTSGQQLLATFDVREEGGKIEVRKK